MCRIGAAREDGPKVWKTLMSIEFSRNKRLRSERTLICAAAGVHARDRPSRYGYRGCVFFVVREPSRLYQCDAVFPASPTLPLQSLPHPVHPDNPGHPASDVIAIKDLTDLFSLLRRRSIDISRNKMLRSDRTLIGTVRFLCLKEFLRSIQICTGHD